MKLVKSKSPEIEPEWDNFSIDSLDFRPHRDGNLVNIFSTIHPKENASETQNYAIECARKLAAWILEHRNAFGDGDGFQIIIGWSKEVRATGRQIVRTGGDFNDLQAIASGTKEIQMHGNWTANVF